MALQKTLLVAVLVVALATGTSDARSLHQLDLGNLINSGIQAVQGLVNATSQNNSTATGAGGNATAPLGQFFNNITAAINQTVTRLNETEANGTTATPAPVPARNATGDLGQVVTAGLGQFLGNLTQGLSNVTSGLTNQSQATAAGATPAQTQFPAPGRSGAAGTALSSLVGMVAGALVLLML